MAYLIQLETTMVSVLHKELEYKLEKVKNKKFLCHAAEDQNQIRTSSWWINHPGSVHTRVSFSIVIDQYSLSFISED